MIDTGKVQARTLRSIYIRLSLGLTPTTPNKNQPARASLWLPALLGSVFFVFFYLGLALVDNL